MIKFLIYFAAFYLITILTLFLTHSKRDALTHIRFINRHVLFQIIALSAYVIAPIAIQFYRWNINVLTWYMDDSRYDRFRESGYAVDYESWLNDRGGKETFWVLYQWHTRNRMWNVYKFINIPIDKEYIERIITNTAILRDKPIQIADATGFIRHENSPGLKFFDKAGNSGWSINSGTVIAWDYTIVGTIKYYFTINDQLFFRYGTCFKLVTAFKRDWYINFGYGTGRERYKISFKIQPTKKI